MEFVKIKMATVPKVCPKMSVTL